MDRPENTKRWEFGDLLLRRARCVLLLGKAGLDLNGVPSGAKVRDGDPQALVAKHISVGLWQSKTGNRDAIDPHDRLRTALQTCRIGDSQFEFRAIIVGDKGVGGQFDLEGRAEQTAVETAAFHAERRQGHLFAGDQPFAGLSVHQGKALRAAGAVFRTESCGNRGRQGRIIAGGNGIEKNDERHALLPVARDDLYRTALGQRIGVVGHRGAKLLARAGINVEAGALTADGGHVDERVLVARPQRDPVNEFQRPGNLGLVGGVRHDHANTHLPRLVARKHGQIIQSANGTVAAIEDEAGFGRIDIDPQFVGRIHGAVDPVALAHLHGQRIDAGNEHLVGHIDRQDATAVGRLDRMALQFLAVDEDRDAGGFRHDRNGVFQRQP